MKSELNSCVFPTNIRESELEGKADSVAEAKPKSVFSYCCYIFSLYRTLNYIRT